MSDTELIQACIKENTVAQKILFEQYASTLLGIGYRYAKNQMAAEEILQLSFIKIFNSIKHFRFESNLKTWMTKITINTALNYIKANEKVKWESDVDTLNDSNSFAVEQLHQIDLKTLMACIQELPTGYRLVLNMFAIEGYSHKEIAQELNINESTSRSQFARAKVLLQQKLQLLGFELKNYGKQ
jgi:RNA polymerase sigma factor (sigma-70 family)